VNTVLFLRPTESLTIFLQQLGRGLRRAPDKDALTLLDFVGQAPEVPHRPEAQGATAATPLWHRQGD
jgi:superfamily II DNA or RNA helicase